MRDIKRQLREMALLQRGSLSTGEFSLWSHLIQERVLRFAPYLVSSSVALYSPIRNEVATAEIRNHALRMMKKVFYPRPGIEKNLDLIQVTSAEDFKTGRYGIHEPTGEKFLPKQGQKQLVVFVPGLGFDLQGNRLGRGEGWYDRALESFGKEPRFIALAYEFQIMGKVPVERWDRKVHYIVTERRIIDCKNV
ncbi:MAG: 5-formyltetrahydrofolate cyclo-ligase [Candidatus Binatia bacterium]